MVDRRHAVPARDLNTFLPLLVGLRRRPPRVVAEDHPVEPAGMLLNEPHSGGATHRHAAPMGALDAERVHQGDHVVAQQLEGVTACGFFGLAVAALIVAQHAELAFEVGGLRVPHVQIGGERIGEDQQRRTLRAADFIIERDAVGFDLHATLIL
jgi:hypothetical protein